MGKIIERVRARETARKERFRRANPLRDLIAMQQQRMANQQNMNIWQLGESAFGSNAWRLNRGAGLQNAYPYQRDDSEPSTEIKKPWWRRWF